MIPGRCSRLLVAAATICACQRSADTPPEPQLEVQPVDTDVLLQAVSVVGSDVVWVSGHRATFARTLDGGATWQVGVVPGPDTLQFRDVHAVSADVAYLLAAGPADMSRIYKTTDGGTSWNLQFVNDHPDAFFDCMDFWDADHGMAFSDAVDGRLRVIETSNGEDWNLSPQDAIPAARGSEGGFAASGTCLVAHGDSTAWIGSGAGEVARVYRTDSRGADWSVVESPIVSGTGTSGITTVLFRDESWGMVLGGEIADTASFTDNVAVTEDGGRTWTVVGRPSFPGAVYGSSLVPGLPDAAVAVGPRGASYTLDAGTTWLPLDAANHWAVAFAGPDAGWMVGPGGRITKVRFADR